MSEEWLGHPYTSSALPQDVWDDLRPDDREFLRFLWSRPQGSATSYECSSFIQKFGQAGWNALLHELMTGRGLIERAWIRGRIVGHPSTPVGGYTLTTDGRDLMTWVSRSADAPGERDGLTGLLRREEFDLDLPELVRGSDESLPLGLVMGDLDHFKAVNDTHGHRAGDAVLHGVGAVLLNAAQGKARAYRYGGEEMIALLPNYSKDEAASFAERVRREIEAATFDGINVTASFGVAAAPDDASNGAELVKKADAALYSAKSGGRNRVC